MQSFEMVSNSASVVSQPNNLGSIFVTVFSFIKTDLITQTSKGCCIYTINKCVYILYIYTYIIYIYTLQNASYILKHFVSCKIPCKIKY